MKSDASSRECEKRERGARERGARGEGRRWRGERASDMVFVLSVAADERRCLFFFSVINETHIHPYGQ
jgi:hypothetical protein